MQFETDTNMVCLCGIMGETATSNVRAWPPNTKEEIEERHLKETTVLNLWRVPMKEKIPSSEGPSGMRIDFLFDGRDTVSIYLRYSMHIYKSDAPPSGLILTAVLSQKRPLSVIDKEGENDSEEDQVVCIEDEFDHDGCLVYRVTSIKNDCIEAI
eukprot:scaffold229626_cov73-Attheya_sp.AAC.2